MPIRKPFSILLFFYSALIVLLGFWGYQSAGSAASLYAGLFFGAACLIGSALMFIERRLGCYIGLLSSGFLSLVFSLRFYKNPQFFRGTALLISALVFFAMIYQTYQINRRR